MTLPAKLRDLAESLEGCEWNHPITAVETCRRAAELIERLTVVVCRADTAMQLVFKWASFTHEHWDADRDSKVGKCLRALDGSLPGYAPDTDIIHSIAREVNGAATTNCVRDCSTCRSLVGCERARGGGPDGFPCWEAAKAKEER